VPREAFVPANKRGLAYLDLDLDVSEGGGAKRYLIKPAVMAKMLQAAEIASTDRVLVVGCATGYAPAVVAGFAGDVFATESEPALADRARATLSELGAANVTVRNSPAAKGDAADAPFDVIVLNGATEIVPQELFEQLREGGRLVGVFALSQPQRAAIVTHTHGDFGHRPLFDAVAPILPGLERSPAFVF
jgi:protein-L-isoaspartate(D-aspartate) O-methyltransferase